MFQITQEITLYITDVNDESPVFEQNRYQLEIPEVSTLFDGLFHSSHNPYVSFISDFRRIYLGHHMWHTFWFV